MKGDRSVLKSLVFVGWLLYPSVSSLAAEDTSRHVKEPPVVQVTWNIRSGLPSPEWSVTDPGAIEALRQLLSNLPPASPPTGWHEFGGFILWAYMNPEPIDFPKYVAVKSGIVKIVAWSSADTAFFQDKNGLEDFLLAEARSRGFDMISSPDKQGGGGSNNGHHYEYPHGENAGEVTAQTLQKLPGTVNNDAALKSAEAWMGKTEPVPQDWKRIDANGKFTFFVPPDMEAEAVQGTDSYVGRYRSTSLRLYFDYGWWPGNLCDARSTEQKPPHTDVATQIGGQRARLVTFSEPHPTMDRQFPYVAVVCFADLGTAGAGQKITLTMWANGNGRAEQQVAEKIFRSIQFSRF